MIPRFQNRSIFGTLRSLVSSENLFAQVQPHVAPSARVPRSQRLFAPSPNLGTSLAFYRGQKGLSLENRRKESGKGFPGPLGPGAEKAQKRVENDYFSSFFRVFGSFSTLLRAFSAPGREAPGTPFQTLFGGFLGRGLFDPCRRPTMHPILTTFGEVPIFDPSPRCSGLQVYWRRAEGVSIEGGRGSETFLERKWVLIRMTKKGG